MGRKIKANKRKKRCKIWLRATSSAQRFNHQAEINKPSPSQLRRAQIVEEAARG